MEKVGLTQSGMAVDEEGVVVRTRLLRDGHGGGVGKPVGLADHKVLKGVFGDEAGLEVLHRWSRRRGCRHGGCARVRGCRLSRHRSGVDEVGVFERIEDHGDVVAVYGDTALLDGREEAISHPAAVKVGRSGEPEDPVVHLGLERLEPRLPGIWVDTVAEAKLEFVPVRDRWVCFHSGFSTPYGDVVRMSTVHISIHIMWRKI